MALRWRASVECHVDGAHDACPEIYLTSRPVRWNRCDCTCHVDATITPAYVDALTTYLQESN